MAKKLWSFGIDLWRDGSVVLGGIAAPLSIAFTLAKAFDVEALGHLREISYAWGLAPLTLWFFIAYVRCRANNAAKIAALESGRDSKEARRKLREALGTFLIEGQELQAQCHYVNREPANSEANAWAERVEQFLQDNLDSGHIARFRDGSGLPVGANSISSIPHRQLWSGLRVRLARLSQFIAEIPV